MARKPACPRVVAPAQREHVANSFDGEALVPAVLQTFLKEDQIADADLLPIPRELGRCPRWPRPGSIPARSAGRRRWRLREIAVSGGGQQQVVEVAVNERHESSASGMHAASR